MKIVVDAIKNNTTQTNLYPSHYLYRGGGEPEKGNKTFQNPKLHNGILKHVGGAGSTIQQESMCKTLSVIPILQETEPVEGMKLERLLFLTLSKCSSKE